MKPLFGGTRVCGPAMVLLEGRDPLGVAAIVARRSNDGVELGLASIGEESISLSVPGSVIDDGSLSLPCHFSSDRGPVVIREVMLGDERWLPVIGPRLRYEPAMLEAAIFETDHVERVQDEGPYDVDEWDTVDIVEALVSDATDEVYAITWRVRGDKKRWWLTDRGWSEEPPIASHAWLRALGPQPWLRDPDSALVKEIHPTALESTLSSFTFGDPISRLVAELLGCDGENTFLLPGDIPAAERESLRTWLQDSRRDPADAMVRFVDGSAELPAEWVRAELMKLDAIRWRERDHGAAIDRVAAAMQATPWRDLAVLAQEAGASHALHDPCSFDLCQRFHAARIAMARASEVATAHLEALRADFVNSAPNPQLAQIVEDRRYVLSLIEYTIKALSPPSPFSGFIEAPTSIIGLIRRWSHPIAEPLNVAEGRMLALLTYLYAIEFPDSGDVDVNYVADLVAPPWDPSDA